MAVARSLAEAFALRHSTTSLLLAKSLDMVCMNLMCEKVSQGCACRLALSLSRLEQLQCLDISDNKLSILPESLWQPPLTTSLTVLNISRNNLRKLPSELGYLRKLSVLDVRFNALGVEAVPWAELRSLPLLKHIRIVEGNDALFATLAVTRLLPHNPGLVID